MADIEIPSRRHSLDEVKEQAAIITVDITDFIYEVYATQAKRNLLPDDVIDRVPERFKVISEDEVIRHGKELTENITIWFEDAPSFQHPPDRDDFIDDVATQITAEHQPIEKLREVRDNPPESLSVADVVQTTDYFRDRIHRSTGFRDTWLLHDEETVINIEGKSFMVEDNQWERENMDEFSTQVRKVLDNLDLKRDVRETASRQRRMRRLLRMAGMAPLPILNAPVTGRPQPVLDRLR